MKKIIIVYFLLLSFILFSCTSSLGKKGEWTATYKEQFVSDCKIEIQSEQTLVQLDSLTISKICNCVAAKAEEKFAPLEMEQENAQEQMKTISTDCARDILIENLNKN